MLMCRALQAYGVVWRWDRAAAYRGSHRLSERGSGVVEWLGISALSIGVLVVLFAALEAVGLSLINAISSQLGL